MAHARAPAPDALLVLSTTSPSLGQSGDELAQMRKDIEALKESQKALQRDLQDIKGLLRARVAPPAAQGPRHGATVKKAVGEGQRAGVRGTPTSFVGRSADGRTVQATRMLRGAQP